MFLIVKLDTIHPLKRATPFLGPIAQLVRAGDSSKWCVYIEKYRMNGMNSGKP